MKKYCQILRVVFLIVIILLLMLACQKGGFNHGSTFDKEKTGLEQLENDKNIPKKLENTDISILTADKGISAENEAVIWFEEKYGGKVTLILAPGSEWPVKLAAMVTSGDSPDVITWAQKDMPGYAIKGLVQPIEDYFDLKHPLWAEGIDAMNQFKYKNRYYGVYKNIQPFFIYFNETIFDNNGIKTPLEYYKEGNWDLENFRNVAMTLTQDINRDGVIDQWGFASPEKGLFVFNNGGDYVKFKQDGGIELTLNDSKVIEGLQFYQDAILKHKYTRTGIDVTVEFPRGKVAMVANRLDFLSKWPESGQMKDKWDMVPLPTAPGQRTGIGLTNCSFWAIPTGAKNPQGGAVFIYLRQKENRESEDEGLAEKFTKEQIKLYREVIRKSIVINKHQGIGQFNKKMGTIFSELEKGVSPINLIEKHASLLQDEVNLILKELQ